METLNSSPLFEKIPNEELEKDSYLECMKNTDEAKKVKRNNGSMFYGAWRRIKPKINTFNDLLNAVKNQKQEDETLE